MVSRASGICHTHGVNIHGTCRPPEECKRCFAEKPNENWCESAGSGATRLQPCAAGPSSLDWACKQRRNRFSLVEELTLSLKEPHAPVCISRLTRTKNVGRTDCELVLVHAHIPGLARVVESRLLEQSCMWVERGGSRAVVGEQLAPGDDVCRVPGAGTDSGRREEQRLETGWVYYKLHNINMARISVRGSV